MPKHERDLTGRGGVWPWLLTNGPHGPSFEWGQSPQAPRDHRDIDLLRRFIAERADASPSFATDARAAAMELLTTGEETVFLRRAIQVMAVLGTPEDIGTIEKYLRHSNAGVRKDARACLFELGVRC